MSQIDPQLIKQETVRQWSGKLAEAFLGDEYDRGTREFFDEVERSRYELYPWLPSEYLESERWAGKDVLEIGVGFGTDHLTCAKRPALAK